MIRCISQDHWHRQGSGLDPRIACVFSVLFVTSHRFSRVLAHVAVMNGIKSSEFFMNMCSSSKITSCRKVLIVISTNDNWKNAFFSSITTAPGLFCLHDISILSAARTALDVQEAAELWCWSAKFSYLPTCCRCKRLRRLTLRRFKVLYLTIWKWVCATIKEKQCHELKTSGQGKRFSFLFSTFCCEYILFYIAFFFITNNNLFNYRVGVFSLQMFPVLIYFLLCFSETFLIFQSTVTFIFFFTLCPKRVMGPSV